MPIDLDDVGHPPDLPVARVAASVMTGRGDGEGPVLGPLGNLFE